MSTAFKSPRLGSGPATDDQSGRGRSVLKNTFWHRSPCGSSSPYSDVWRGAFQSFITARRLRLRTANKGKEIARQAARPWVSKHKRRQSENWELAGRTAGGASARRPPRPAPRTCGQKGSSALGPNSVTLPTPSTRARACFGRVEAAKCVFSNPASLSSGALTKWLQRGQSRRASGRARGWRQPARSWFGNVVSVRWLVRWLVRWAASAAQCHAPCAAEAPLRVILLSSRPGRAGR